MEATAKDKSNIIKALVQSYQRGQTERIKQSLESLLTATALEVDPAQVDILKDLVSSINLERKMLSTGEVAKKLGVSTQTVVNWIESGKLKAFRSPGGHYRIPAHQFKTTEKEDAEFDDFFKRQQEKYKDILPLDDDELSDV